jgi:uncharacterized protein YciI
VPHYVFLARDKPGCDASRTAARARHREHIRQEIDGCRCILGGPLFDRPEGRMVGSLLVFDAPSEQAVTTFMSADPYVLAGIFDVIEIHVGRVGLGSIV